MIKIINFIKILPYSQYFSVREKIKMISQIPGDHNVQNALGAYCIGKYLKIPDYKILKSCINITALERMEFRAV